MIKELRAAIINDTVLSGIVGERIYPLRAPQTAARPFIVMNVFDVTPKRCFDGLANLAETAIQVDIYAEKYSTCENIRSAIRRLIDGQQNMNLSGTNVRSIRVDSQLDSYVQPSDGSDTFKYRKTLDVYIWHEDETLT